MTEEKKIEKMIADIEAQIDKDYQKMHQDTSYLKIESEISAKRYRIAILRARIARIHGRSHERYGHGIPNF